MPSGGQNLAKLDGQRFGRLVVLRLEKRENGKAYWLCKCDCGREVIKTTQLLRRKNKPVRSCGCLRKEVTSKTFSKHGFSRMAIDKVKATFYRKWKNMKSRCENHSNEDYRHYGGRGITIEWDSFEEFHKDIWDTFIVHVDEFSLKQTTLDRVDCNGNYSKGNCRWATWSTQVENRTLSKERRVAIAKKGWETRRLKVKD